MKPIHAIIGGWILAGTASAAHTAEYSNLTSGQPIHAVRDTFTTSMGPLAYALFAGALFVGLWLRTNLLFAVLMLDLADAGLLWQYLPPEVQIFVYILNIVSAGIIFFKLVSPVYGE